MADLWTNIHSSRGDCLSRGQMSVFKFDTDRMGRLCLDVSPRIWKQLTLVGYVPPLRK